MEPQCPKCKAHEPMLSKKRQVYICDSCGHEYKLEKPFLPQRIFISYGHDEHAPLAMRIRDDLRHRGHEAWFDEERLLPGADWESRIEEGLSWAAEGKPQAAFILLLTPHSVRRPDGFCLNEVAHALTLKLRIIPLMVVESEPPLSICRIQWLDMRECIPINEKEPLYKPRFKRLLTALEQNELDYQGVQSRLLNLLKPIEFSADLLKLLRDFTGRQWVFEEIDAWFKNPAGAKVFWLTGAPGVGKSAIAAWIRENRREVAAFHFCDINSEEKRNPARLVCSIAYQLSTQLPEYQQRLGRLDLENIVKEYHEAYTLFDMLLVQPLTDNFPEPDRTIVVLIDALDEATNRRRNEIVRFLSRSADKTPSWLRFLVTSRPEPEITASFQALSPYVLDTGKAENLADLRKYIRTKIPEITPAETEAIISRSEGVFLYVQHVVESILTKTLDLHNIDQFPRGLGDVYHQFFERQFGEDLGYYEDKIVPLLQPVLAAFEPLTREQLKGLCSITEDTELERRLNRLGSLFPTGGQGECETIRPFHRSLSDWITDRRSAGHFVIAESDGHRILADHCWNEYQKGSDTLSPYSLRFLPTHLVATQRWDDLIGDDTTPGPLTDLRFIQAKCEAGLVFDLILDYNLALAELPEFKEEQEYLRQRDKAVLTYNRALKDYALKRFYYLQLLNKGEPSSEPPYPEPPKILDDLERPSIPEKSSIRAARLRYFSNFVSHYTSPLAKFPGETLSLAYNNAREGPVSAQAEQLIKARVKPWLRRSPRPLPYFRPQCLRILEGHIDWVKSISITTDGYRAVSGSGDKTLKLWDLETGTCLKNFNGHKDWINIVCVTSKDHLAISGSGDKAIKVWDLETGKCLNTMKGHNARINSLDVTSDDRRIISGSGDKTIKIWDLETGKCLNTMKGHNAKVKCVCLTPEGRRIVSGSGDKTLKVWDLNTGACLHTMEGHSASINSIFISPDGRHVVSGSGDKTLRVWDLESGTSLSILKGHKARVNSVFVSPEGHCIISASGDKTIRLWDFETGACLYILEGHSAMVKSVSVTSDGRCAVSGSGDKTLRVWSLESRAYLHTLEGHNARINCVNITSKKHQALTGSGDKTLRLWDLKNGSCLRILEDHDAWVNSVSVASDGRRAISGSGDKKLKVWDLKTGACLSTIEGHSASINSVFISPEGRHVVSGSDDKNLRLWDLENGDCLHTLKGHKAKVNCVGITPDGRRAISGSSDKTIRLWDLETFICLQILEGLDARVNCISITPDGCLAISSGGDKTLRIWDLKTGACLHKLEGHNDWINSVNVSPDGNYAVSGSWDRTLRVWALKSGKQLALYHVGLPVCSVSFSPNGEHIVCGDNDGQMHFLTPVNFPPYGRGITTAMRPWLFGNATAPGHWDNCLNAQCPWCGRRFTVAESMPGEHISCPWENCTKPIKLNPFIVDNKD